MQYDWSLDLKSNFLDAGCLDDFLDAFPASFYSQTVPSVYELAFMAAPVPLTCLGQAGNVAICGAPIGKLKQAAQVPLTVLHKNIKTPHNCAAWPR